MSLITARIFSVEKTWHLNNRVSDFRFILQKASLLIMMRILVKMLTILKP